MPEGKIATKTGQYYAPFGRKKIKFSGVKRKKGRFLTSKSDLGRILVGFLNAGKPEKHCAPAPPGEKR